MELWEAIVLGFVQGLTEFLPVSSSGHLTLGKAILGITEKGILFEVIVHLGTLLAVFTAFWKDIIWLLNGCLAFVTGRKEKEQQETGSRPALNYAGYIIIATLPAVFVGLFLKDYVERAFNDPLLACYMLLLTGVILAFSRLGLKSRGAVTGRTGFLIGISQAFAILPGISRSGSTIATGMLLGIEREAAARFSFLMAIPAIGGAFVLQLKDLVDAPPDQAYMLALAAGFVVSYVSGLGAIKVLMKLVRIGRFDYFAWYCFAVGLLGIYLLN